MRASKLSIVGAKYKRGIHQSHSDFLFRTEKLSILRALELNLAFRAIVYWGRWQIPPCLADSPSLSFLLD